MKDIATSGGGIRDVEQFEGCVAGFEQGGPVITRDEGDGVLGRDEGGREEEDGKDAA
jgi:hypothetical protein